MRRRSPQSAALPLEITDWLLEGHVRACDDADPARAPGRYDAFLEFDEPGPDLRGLWHAHRSELLREAARRGITEPWGRCFDEEGAS